METLHFINENVIKYIYIIIGLILLVLFVKLLIKLKTTSKYTNYILNKVEDIQSGIENINKKINKVEETKEKSLPLFIDIFLVSIITRAIYKDYKKTKTSKRSIAKSAIRQYNVVHNKYRFKSTKLIKNIISTILKVA